MALVGSCWKLKFKDKPQRGRETGSVIYHRPLRNYHFIIGRAKTLKYIYLEQLTRSSPLDGTGIN